jgi:hypothetical protein
MNYMDMSYFAAPSMLGVNAVSTCNEDEQSARHPPLPGHLQRGSTQSACIAMPRGEPRRGFVQLARGRFPVAKIVSRAGRNQCFSHGVKDTKRRSRPDRANPRQEIAASTHPPARRARACVARGPGSLGGCAGRGAPAPRHATGAAAHVRDSGWYKPRSRCQPGRLAAISIVAPSTTAAPAPRTHAVAAGARPS